ncbi:helix-turn-helix transcriptional regulator [Vagococcus carniphilus]|uniref:helix-turn-helix transcriptional regulator n=1 Tax=Vagococcus carniphilus TaxID=218144 RepID=UPI000F864D91|nr:helix-turn-helix domain-containing protein [Vagococcus carniphilus]QNN73266.1 helix-turn-helix domain-containing protein [Vagococcus carniphilus]
MNEVIINDFLEMLSIKISKKLIEQSSIADSHYFTKTENRYMNKTETCKYVNVSNNTLNKWIQNGFPEIVCGGITRYSKDEIDLWMKQHLKK